MINDVKGLAEYIQNWLILQARMSKSESLVVGVSGGIDSAVVLALAYKTGLPTYGVMMPCYSSKESLTRSKELLAKYPANSFRVSLEDAYESIAEQVPFPDGTNDTVKNATGALRSCLRAPTLDYVAKVFKGIIVGTGNKDEDEVTRYYQKRGDGAVDVSPIAHLHKSDVYQLAAYLEIPESIINATPSADLWGPDGGQTDEGQLGMTYAEIERATKMVEQLYNSTKANAFIQLANNLSKHSLADTRTIEVLRKLGDMEIASRHKANTNIPICNIKEAGYLE